MKSKFFNLFIVDHDRKLFNVIESLTNDSFHNKLIVKAQQLGRDVRAFSSHEVLDKSISDYETQMGYKYTKDNVLIK